MSFVIQILAIYLLTTVSANRTVLEVPGYGTIQGMTARSFYEDRDYYAFHSLFYAKPPRGNLRFLPPVPVDPMPEDEIYDAITWRPGCPQGDNTTENCLFVNVYTPYLPGNASDPDTNFDNLLPVMFWIHGGGYSSGSVLGYTPWKFMDKDVVMVAVQYRLGPLGFLTLDTDEVPGNAGTFDQIEGLRWVQKFIKYFGGDPNKVTIFGESAGGASVAHLLLAPQANGLFHNAIGQSGSSFVDWALDRQGAKSGWKIVEYAGCPLEPYEAVLDCLHTIDSDKLFDAYGRLGNEDQRNGGLGFVGGIPVIQRAGKERCLTDEPEKLIKSGNYNKQVNIMFGANQQDGSYALASFYFDYLTELGLENDTYFLTYDIVPTLLKAFGSPDLTHAISDAVIEKYIGEDAMGNWEAMAPGLVDLCSVLCFKGPSYRMTQLHSEQEGAGRAYWYSFDFRGRFSVWLYFFFGEWPPIPHGITHADELMYIFTFPEPHNETEHLLSKRMIQAWTNFAQYGDPTPDGIEMPFPLPKWSALNNETLYFMSINDEWVTQQDFTDYYALTANAKNPNRKKKSLTKKQLHL